MTHRFHIIRWNKLFSLPLVYKHCDTNYIVVNAMVCLCTFAHRPTPTDMRPCIEYGSKNKTLYKHDRLGNIPPLEAVNEFGSHLLSCVLALLAQTGEHFPSTEIYINYTSVLIETLGQTLLTIYHNNLILISLSEPF